MQEIKIKLKMLKKIHQAKNSKKRFVVLYGGRGSGKSYGVAQIMVLRAMEERCRILCTRQVQASLAESSKAIIERVIRDMQVEDVFEITNTGIICTKTGSEFLFRGMQKPETIQSFDNLKYCFVEEAQSLTQNALDILIPTIRAEDSQFYIVFNPRSREDPVYKRFIAINDTQTLKIKQNYYDNVFLPKVLKDQAEWDKKYNYEKYKWTWEGEPLQMSEALVFAGKWRIEDFPEYPDVQRYYYGMDFGFSMNPSVLVRCFVRDRRLYVDYESYGLGVEIDKLPAMMDKVPGARKWIIYGDSERPDTISYLRRNGFNIMPADKGTGSIEEGIEYIKSFQEIVIHSRCKNTIGEFGTYSYKVDRRTEEVLPVIEDKNNHCIDAIRYALCKEVKQKDVNIRVLA